MKSPRNNRLVKQSSRVRFIVILLIALAVRLVGISSRPIWYDEAFAILFSEKGLDAMLYGTLAPTGTGSADIHPLGYYTLLSFWMKIFGQSLLATRTLSIFAGMSTACLIYSVARELTSKKTAQLSMLLFALNPFQIHFAQEIRMYSFMMLWLVLATYACQRGISSGQYRWWLLFSVASALAQFTHNLSVFYLLPLALIPLLRKDWRSFRSMIVAGFLAIILYSPWLLHIPAQLFTIQQGYWVEHPEIAEIFTLLIVFVTNTPLPNQWIPFALVIALFIVVIGVKQTISFVRETKQTNGLSFFYLSFAPPVLLFLFSQWKPVYIERALLPSGAIFCIWLAWVITNTNLSGLFRNILISALTVASAMGIHMHATYHDFPYGPFQSLTASLGTRLESEDVIIHSNKLTMLPALLFGHELPQTFMGDSQGSSADTLAPATQEVLGIKEEMDIQSAAEGATRVWYIIYSRSIEDYKASGNPTHPDIAYLDSNFEFVSKET